MTRGAPGRTRVIKTLTRGAPGHDPGHDAISKTSKNVIFEVCDAFKEEPSGQKTQITQVDPPPLPPQQIGLQPQNREIFWEHGQKSAPGHDPGHLGHDDPGHAPGPCK